MGTIYTMAPEVFLGEFYSSKCDMWSIGVMAYQMLVRDDDEMFVGWWDKWDDGCWSWDDGGWYCEM